MFFWNYKKRQQKSTPPLITPLITPAPTQVYDDWVKEKREPRTYSYIQAKTNSYEKKKARGLEKDRQLGIKRDSIDGTPIIKQADNPYLGRRRESLENAKKAYSETIEQSQRSDEINHALDNLYLIDDAISKKQQLI